MGYLAAFDPRRQLPGDAARRAAPAGDGPGRTVALVPIWGTAQRAVKWGWPAVEGVLRLRLVALVVGIATGAEWAPCSQTGADPDRPAWSGAPWATSPPSIRAQLPGDAGNLAAPWPWCRSGAPFNGR